MTNSVGSAPDENQFHIARQALNCAYVRLLKVESVFLCFEGMQEN